MSNHSDFLTGLRHWPINTLRMGTGRKEIDSQGVSTGYKPILLLPSLATTLSDGFGVVVGVGLDDLGVDAFEFGGE